MRLLGRPEKKKKETSRSPACIVATPSAGAWFSTRCLESIARDPFKEGDESAAIDTCPRGWRVSRVFCETIGVCAQLVRVDVDGEVVEAAAQRRGVGKEALEKEEDELVDPSAKRSSQ